MKHTGINIFTVLVIFTALFFTQMDIVVADMNDEKGIVLVQLWENRNPENAQDQNKGSDDVPKDNKESIELKDEDLTHTGDLNDIPDFDKPEEEHPVYQ